MEADHCDLLPQHLRSGTTAMVGLIHGQWLHLAWVGDSQALLVRGGQPVEVVSPHKPDCVVGRPLLYLNGLCCAATSHSLPLVNLLF